MATTTQQNIVFFISQAGTSVADNIPLHESQALNFLLLS
jgi:hypothetical protein